MIGSIVGGTLPDDERARLDALLAKIDAAVSVERSDVIVGVLVRAAQSHLELFGWSAILQFSFADKPAVFFWDRPFFASTLKRWDGAIGEDQLVELGGTIANEAVERVRLIPAGATVNESALLADLQKRIQAVRAGLEWQKAQASASRDGKFAVSSSASDGMMNHLDPTTCFKCYGAGYLDACDAHSGCPDCGGTGLAKSPVEPAK